MKNELKGTVIMLLDEDSGYILGEDNIKYLFLDVDYMHVFTLSVNDQVLFKPKKISTNKGDIFKATMISKE